MFVLTRTSGAQRQAPPECAGSLRAEPRRRQRSSAVAFGSNSLSRRQRWRCFRAALQPRSQLVQRRPLGNLPDLIEQVIRQRHACERCTRLELLVQGVRHVADLDHRSHADNINACASHVKLPRACHPRARTYRRGCAWCFAPPKAVSSSNSPPSAPEYPGNPSRCPSPSPRRLKSRAPRSCG